MKYVDPGGGRPCIDNDENGQCIVDPDWPRGSKYWPTWERVPVGENEPVASYNHGLNFVSALIKKGWWSNYMTNQKRMWRFLIALAYGYEVGYAWDNPNVKELMPQAFANKLTYLVSKYGAAGYYIFLGSMETIQIRIDDIMEGTFTAPDYLEGAFTKTSGIWNGTLSSSDPNAPYDFANPMPGKHPEDLLTRLYEFANSCQNKVSGCETRGLEGTLYALASWNKKGDKWEIFFIVSYTQEMSWK